MLKFIGGLVLIAAAVFALGYALGWWKVSKDTTGDRSEFSLHVDEKKVEEDTTTAKNRVGDTVAGLTRDKVEGRLVSVDAPTRSLVLQKDGDTLMELLVAADAEIRIDDREITLAALPEDSALEVWFTTEEGQAIARRIVARGN